MRNAARRLPAEDHIHYPEDEGPLDAYSRVVAAVVDRVGPAVVRVESVAGRRAGVGPCSRNPSKAAYAARSSRRMRASE